MGKFNKNTTFYLIMLIVFGILMYLITIGGEAQEVESAIQTSTHAPRNMTEGFGVFTDLVIHHIQSDLGILLLQIVIILIFCRIFGWIFSKMGQPTVIGEIVAGIVLGPSILGNIAPGVSSFLFPEESLQNINIISQFGLILFMFAIGMELSITEIRKKLNETILISHTSIIVPFLLGMVTAFFLYGKYTYESTPFLSFALFISISLSITAFPVLARIIQEKGMTKKHLGKLAVASAANGDITAWCLLAVVVSIAQAGSALSAIYNILFALVYILFMGGVIRPLLQMIGHVYHNKEVVDKGLVGFIFLLLIASSFMTEILGLHALFGAFIAGVVMPENLKFRKIMTEKVEDVSLALFLPLFFVSTGLRTEIGLLNSPDLWYMCSIFILVAIIGKFGGSMIAARIVGETWKHSLYMGALMNTRGLMELVVLTIGYDMKILTPPVFVMLVLMTLVTTFMTTPLISLIQFCYRIYGKRIRSQQAAEIVAQQTGVFKVLLSFGRASNGLVMLDVAYQLFSHAREKLEITALHLTVGPDVNPMHADNFEEVSFGPILYGAQKLGIPIHTRYEISNNAGFDICNIANRDGYDFLLVGAGISMSDVPTDVEANRYLRFRHKILGFFTTPGVFYPGELLKDKTKTFIEQSHCPVGVFINRKFVRATNTLIIEGCDEDRFLQSYADSLERTTQTERSTLRIPQQTLTGNLLSGFNFMLISYNTWNKISKTEKDALQQMPSTLILSQGLTKDE